MYKNQKTNYKLAENGEVPPADRATKNNRRLNKSMNERQLQAFTAKHPSDVALKPDEFEIGLIKQKIKAM